MTAPPQVGSTALDLRVPAETGSLSEATQLPRVGGKQGGDSPAPTGTPSGQGPPDPQPCAVLGPLTTGRPQF